MNRSMKLLLIAMFGILTLSFTGSDLCAEEAAELGIKADFRWRMEADGLDFDADTDTRTFSWLRARLGVKLEQGDVKAFMQLQYPHKLDWNASNLGGEPPPVVHQAYLHVNRCFFQPGLKLKVGRFEMKYGDERLVGAVGWSNHGRVFDGMIFHKEMELGWFDLILTRQTDRSSSGDNDPSDQFLGLWGFVKPINLDLFYLHNIAASPNQGGDHQVSLSRSTVGLHYENQYGSGLGTNLDFAYQMGTMKSFADTSEADIGAWMTLLEVWYKMEHPMSPKLTLGGDITSGDDPKTPDLENFNNLYYTGHAFRGNMDLFIASNPQGLRDIYLKAQLMPLPIVKLMLALHNFSTMEDYASVVDGKEATALGNEIDFELIAGVRPNLKLSLGLSYFMPAEEWKGKDADNAFWGYISLHTTLDTSPK